MLSKSGCVFLATFFLVAATFAWGDLSHESIDRSLTKGSNPVWYDENEQALTFPTAAALQAAEDVLLDRHQNIETDQPADPISNGGTAWWDPIFEVLATVIPWLLWSLVAFFLVGFGIYLWLAVERGVEGRRRRNDTYADDLVNREKAKLVDLPFSIDVPSRNLYEQAQVSRRDGDFAKSIIYLFSHILVEMDKANCIRLQRGKTNQSYLQELRNDPNLAKLYQHSVRVFEAVFFGRYAVNQEECERFWSLLPPLQQSIGEAVQRRTTSNEPYHSTLHSTLGLLVLANVIGCGDGKERPLDNYGASNAYNRKSVSGLTVFRELCEQRKLLTNELTSLSERSYRFDAIVWVPKDFRLPNEREIEWFDHWLSQHPGRKLIWVGRDYSPASHYWEKATESSAPEDRRTYRLEQAYAESDFELARIQSAPKQKCEWFEQRLEKNIGRRVEKFEGPWANPIDADKSDIYLRGELLPTKDSPSNASRNGSRDDLPGIQTLLASSDGSPIVSSISHQYWGNSQLILVANGSVLMNEAITNRGNRQIAERLIDQCSPKGRIGFLSNNGDTKIHLPSDAQDPKGFEWLRVWPLSLIAIQGLFVGSIALLAMLPIFGRPQRLPSPSTTDFGKHIEALGDLLAQTRDRNYALQRIADYFRDVRRDLASPWSNVTAKIAEPSPNAKSKDSHSVSTSSIHSTHKTS